MERTTYVVVTWPETQTLTECDGFDENAYLINDDNGINDICIGSEELLDALQVKDTNGTDLDFISQDAIDIYDEIFFFADSQTLALEDDELIKKLIGDNPDFAEWIG